MRLPPAEYCNASAPFLSCGVSESSRRTVFKLLLLFLLLCHDERTPTTKPVGRARKDSGVSMEESWRVHASGPRGEGASATVSHGYVWAADIHRARARNASVEIAAGLRASAIS